ncbi:MAG: SLBB domain-containing protein, partial [Anaerolineae bacterium]|nr:SLBB domain-containing protein [Anaerolineae bacterium]
GEFWQLAAKLDACIEELKKAGLLGESLFGSNYSLQLFTHLGAGAYVCGEETALLESIEGKMGQPRLRPPFPAVHGLYGCPTVINNVETLTNVPPIVQNGADWYKSIGTEKSAGVKIFSLSGCVNRPGNYELPLGTPFRELIETCGGGIKDGHKLKAVMTAGASSTIVPADEHLLDVPMDYESVQQQLGCPLGSASVIILDDSVNIGWLVSKTVNFFKHESCGKCTPCREGTFWMNQITNRMTSGKGKTEDIDLLLNVSLQTVSVISGVQKFRNDFEALVADPAAVMPAGEAH